MKTKEAQTAGAEGLSDAELSRRLGRYQRQARLWRRVGLLAIAGGLIAAVAVGDAALKTVLVALLFGGGLCCVLFLSAAAQKKQKALMQEQLGAFFRVEMEKAFGRKLHTPELRIDRPLLHSLSLLENRWEESEEKRFREGVCRGVHFSAANVRLYHVYEQGHGQGSLGTGRDLVYQGLVLRCETDVPAPSPLCVTAEQDAAALLPPQFTAWLSTFAPCVEGTLSCVCWEKRVFTLALETNYVFADVASDVDVRDLDAVRRSYCTSLREMEKALELLRSNEALFARQA